MPPQFHYWGPIPHLLPQGPPPGFILHSDSSPPSSGQEPSLNSISLLQTSHPVLFSQRPSPQNTRQGPPSPDSILGVPHPVLSTQGPPAPALLTRTPPPLNLTAESAAPHPLRRGPRCPDLTTQGPHPTLSTQGTPGPPFPLRSPHLPTSLLRDPRPFLTPAKPGLLTRRRPRWWGTGPRRWRG